MTGPRATTVNMIRTIPVRLTFQGIKKKCFVSYCLCFRKECGTLCGKLYRWGSCVSQAQFPVHKMSIFFYAPAIYNGGGGGAYSITLVRTYIRTYICTSRTSCPVRTKNGFRAISFENTDVLDSYFIHRYIIIKYRSSSIMDKIHQLLSELWPLISE